MLFRSGATVPRRKVWLDIWERGQHEGWYHIHSGEVQEVRREGAGKLCITFKTPNLDQVSTLNADFIIDATGLDANIEHHPILKDLLDCYEPERNILDQLALTENFELEDMRNGRGRIYVSGSAGLGNSYAPVDSFLGLQYSASRAVAELFDLGADGLNRLSSFRSCAQWISWVRGVSP